jgi:hypothetical protein
MESKEKLAQ